MPVIKDIEVRGEGVGADTKSMSVEFRNYIIDLDSQVGTFTVESAYCEMLPAGYYRVLITFCDENGKGDYLTSVGITVSQPAQ